MGILISGNTALNNGRSGFEVNNGANMGFLGNTAKWNARDGFRILGTDTILKKNRAKGNGEFDYYNAGTGTILGTGNHFGTIGGP